MGATVKLCDWLLGNKLYEGEMINNLKHGCGKEYYTCDPGKEVVCYKGEFKNGKREGFGIRYFRNGRKWYEGYWSNNLEHGYGTLYHKSGIIVYKGHFFKGRQIDCWDVYTEISGQAVKGENLPDGYYILFTTAGIKCYEGEIRNNRRWGRGRSYYPNGQLEYDGDWVDGLQSGKGKEYYETSELKYEGTWLHGNKQGYGRSFYKNGFLMHVGGYYYNQPFGEGFSYYDTGRIKYDGFFEDFFISRGKEYYKNGNLKFEGDFNKGPRHYYGPRYYVDGKLYYESGELWYEGTFTMHHAFSLDYPVFRGSDSFLKGKEYDRDGNLIREINPVVECYEWWAQNEKKRLIEGYQLPEEQVDAIIEAIMDEEITSC